MTLYICDGYFDELPVCEDPALKPLARYVSIAKRLPMELQMRLSNLAFDLNKSFVLSAALELSLKKLARTIL